MDVSEKLMILADSAKYDVACTSSGSSRAGKRGALGSAVQGGICHSFSADGRCISLLKILLTNICVYDCKYCVNRRSNDVPRAIFTPREVAELTVNFYRRNYIEGLFLSSAVVKSPNHTMELIYEAIRIVRHEYAFNGYIHIKAIPGADRELIERVGYLVDRMSVNIEFPSAESLHRLAPDKNSESILKPMAQLKDGIKKSKDEIVLFKHAPRFVPGGQATQLIVGATPESDKRIVALAEGLYKKYSLKRVFYSAYVPVAAHHGLPERKPPLVREHRLYQADFLLRFYGFTAGEILKDQNPNLNLNMDPKCQWAIDNVHMFPVEVNTADYMTLLRVPGIGQRSAERIVEARRVGKLDFTNLKKMGIVLKRAKYFITCGGKMMYKMDMRPDLLEMRLSENKFSDNWEQLSLFDRGEERPALPLLSPKRRELAGPVAEPFLPGLLSINA